MMATCDMGYDHEDAPAAEPVIVADTGEPEASEAQAAAAVEIARLGADRDVAVARIQNRGLDEDTAAELAALQARIDVLEAAAIPPEPEPVVMPMPAAPPVEETPPPPETAVKEKPPSKKKGFFG